jgi:hypothetical protein
MIRQATSSYTPEYTARILGVPLYLLKAMEGDKQLRRVGDGYDKAQVRALKEVLAHGLNPDREYTTGEGAVLCKVIPRMIRARCQKKGLGRKAGQVYLIRGADLQQEILSQQLDNPRRIGTQQAAEKRFAERHPRKQK